MKKPNNLYIFAMLFVVLFLSALNFLRAQQFEYVDWDGFQYLSFSKSLWQGSDLYLNEIRSPLSAFIVVPNWFFARLEMIFFNIVSVFLIYKIVYKITYNSLASVFSSLLYGTSWWTQIFTTATLTDMPAIALFLLFLYFWLGDDKKSALYAGIFGGLGFLVRFDTILFLAPFLAFSAIRRRHVAELLIPAFIIAVPFELAIDYIVFHKWVYTPLEFLKINFDLGLAGLLAARTQGGDWLYAIKKTVEFFPFLAFFPLFSITGFKKFKKSNGIIISFLFLVTAFLFLPIPDNRIFATKFPIFLAILSSYFVIFLQKKFRNKSIAHFLLFLVSLVVVVYNTILVLSVEYPAWRLSDIPCAKEGIVCSNAPSITVYQCGSKSIDIYSDRSGYIFLNDTRIMQENLKKCDYLAYFKGYFGYEEGLNNIFKERFTLITDNSLSSFYKING